MHQYCCNNAVPLLHKVKTLTFDAYDSPLACKWPNAVTKSLIINYHNMKLHSYLAISSIQLVCQDTSSCDWTLTTLVHVTDNAF